MIVETRDVKNWLLQNDFKMIRRKGSHERWEHEKTHFALTIVADRKTMPKGAFSNIVKQLEIAGFNRFDVKKDIQKINKSSTIKEKNDIVIPSEHLPEITVIETPKIPENKIIMPIPDSISERTEKIIVRANAILQLPKTAKIKVETGTKALMMSMVEQISNIEDFIQDFVQDTMNKMEELKNKYNELNDKYVSLLEKENSRTFPVQNVNPANENEIWRNIPEFPGYQISDESPSRVRSWKIRGFLVHERKAATPSLLSISEQRTIKLTDGSGKHRKMHINALRFLAGIHGNE